MDIAINGSYAPYAYLVLLQLSLFYLQRFGASQLVSSPQVEKVSVTGWLDTYCLFTRIVGSTLSWISWMLALYVGYKFDIASGLLFFVVGFGCSVVLMLVIPPSPRIDVIAHILSIAVTVYLLRATLLSIGVEAPL
jgi:hypothetical protein